MKRTYHTFATFALAASLFAVAAPAQAEADNPCGGKASNPCEMKADNPCGAKAANPCGGKAAAMAGVPAVNPCFAKMGTVFMIADPMQRNTITFRSEAPLEDIIGTTNQVQGYLVFDPHSPKKGGRGEITVPVASLRTGIPLRDEHLQGPEWLDANGYPNITFTIEDVRDVKSVKKGDGFTTYEAKVLGSFTLRGVTRNIETDARLTYLEESETTRQKLEGDLLATRASFTVALSEFGVRGFDGVVGSKVGSTIDIDVNVMASASAPGKASNPCSGKSAAKARAGR